MKAVNAAMGNGSNASALLEGKPGKKRVKAVEDAMGHGSNAKALLEEEDPGDMDEADREVGEVEEAAEDASAVSSEEVGALLQKMKRIQSKREEENVKRKRMKRKPWPSIPLEMLIDQADRDVDTYPLNVRVAGDELPHHPDILEDLGLMSVWSDDEQDEEGKPVFVGIDGNDVVEAASKKDLMKMRMRMKRVDDEDADEEDDEEGKPLKKVGCYSWDSSRSEQP